MKYGLQQWGRIASLFSKRTAKQCKARWAEWIDPNIRKTEWSREEDEKLLHMAKLMPTQWRTIAPIVGRTATQCLERYEQLLDLAAGAEPRVEGKSQAQAETLPAKPDAVDMNEEELEMLSEARARLANTLGKKAKRKARQKALEEARRVSLLHRRRELKASGIQASNLGPKKAKRARKNSDAEQIDYVQEIPFQLLAPKGPHDVAAEAEESRRRAHDEQLRKQKLRKIVDMKKRPAKKPKTDGEKLAQQLTAMQALEAQRAAEALAASRQRPDLVLPAPLVTDAELEDVARVVANQQAMGPPPLPAARRDVAFEEARNQLARDRMAAPLAGDGQRAERFGVGTGFGPAPLRAAGVPTSLGSIASRRTFVAGGAKSVVVRDELGINQATADDELAEDAEALADGTARLAGGFKALPQPEFDYQIAAVVPEDDAVVDGDDARQPLRDEDAGAKDRRLEREADERRRQKLARRPLAVQRDLPVPPKLVSWDEGARSDAERLVLREVEAMLDGDDAVDERFLLDEDASLAVAWPAVAAAAVKGGAQLRARFAAARRATAELSKHTDAVLAKVDTRALQERSKALAQRLRALHVDVFKARMELEAYSKLHAAEAENGPLRLQACMDALAEANAQEAELQREYETLVLRG